MQEERTTQRFGPSAQTAVLEDPTGRHARRLRRAGRVVFVLFLAWLLAIVLGGLGLGPVAHVPLFRILRPSPGPPPAPLPAPRVPAPADLLPAAPAPAAVRRAHGLGHVRRAAPPGLAKPHARRGKSGSAPGRTKPHAKPRGKSATAPGRTRTTVATFTTVNGRGKRNGRPQR